ncbi:unnamed protein product, partial [Discosporangium mesarthrocarpum]
GGVTGGSGFELDDRVAKAFARTCAGSLSPLASFYGGLVAQEVLKGCSHLFVPAHQFMYYDCTEALPTPLPSRGACAARGDRYDGQRAVLGDNLQSLLSSRKVFVVGAGAIGCELLKSLALMGVGCESSSLGRGGRVVVTDMDTIEKSNLNRQFLFRGGDVGKAKSHAAAEAVRRMNPFFCITPSEKKVGPESESVFDEDFWESLDVVINALDNVEARLYVDSRCVDFARPLLESGTLGTKGNTQV